jgi:signal recognition particle subunit SRP72
MVSTLASLLKKTHIEDHDEILSSADAALKQSKGDLEVQHVKVVALLKLDRYSDAVAAIEAGGDKLKDKASLEYAYALYKSGKPAEAAEIASKSSQRGYNHVEAQARYRIEDFERAAELYKKLSARHEQDVEADLKVNSSAVDVQLEWAGKGELVQKKKPEREDLEAFETAYNAACGSIARGELAQGEVLLKRARGLVESADDLTDEDKETELLPIAVQQIYVLTKLGRQEEAELMAKDIGDRTFPDRSSKLIARVNGIAAAGVASNPFLAQRLLAFDMETLKPDYPFAYQSAILDHNRAALDLQTSKFGGVIKSSARTLSQQSGATSDGKINSLSAVNAAAHAQNKTGKDALKHILPLLEKRPTDVGLVLTIVQLYVQSKNFSSATTLLENFMAKLEKSGEPSDLDVRHAPGLVGTLISLYSSQTRREPARDALAQSSKYWRNKSQTRPSGVTHLFKAAGSALSESHDPEHQSLAREIFQDLHDQDASDRYSAAGLLAASPATANSTDLSSLQPIDRLISGIDAEALENAGIAQPPVDHSAAAAAASSRKRPAEEQPKPKKHKKLCASKMPKDYDANRTLDPERWLPLRDRSTYRPKGGKKGKAAKQAMLAQGAVSEDVKPSTPGAEVVKGKQQQQGGGAKKKKGKGNKW